MVHENGEANGARWPSRSSKSVAARTCVDGLGSTPRRFRHLFSMRVGPHPHALSLGGWAPRSGPVHFQSLHHPPNHILRVFERVENQLGTARPQLIGRVAAGSHANWHGADHLRACNIVGRIANDNDVG